MLPAVLLACDGDLNILKSSIGAVEERKERLHLLSFAVTASIFAKKVHVSKYRQWRAE